MPVLLLALLLPLALGTPGRPGSTASGPMASGSPGATPLAALAAAASPGPGLVFPHPPAVPAGGLGPSATSQWYIDGSVYDGPSENVTSVSVTVTVPDDVPEGHSWDFYYELLSVWDSAGSYDQIGFDNLFGSWDAVYGYTAPCATVYHDDPNATVLERGATYTFRMTVAAGTVSWEVLPAAGTSPVFTATAGTNGTSFDAALGYTCGTGAEFADYSDTEEVYSTAGPEPPYDIFFTNNTAGGVAVTDWTTWSGDDPPAAIQVLVAGANTTIANEAYYLRFPTGGDTLNTSADPPPGTYTKSFEVAELSPDAPVFVSSYTVPGGWALNLSPSEGAPPFTVVATFTIPADVARGTYLLGFNATDGTAGYARLALSVEVASSALAVRLEASPSVLDVGQNVTLTANATGGTGSDVYRWTSVPTGCVAPTSPSLTCAPSAAGSYPVSVQVTDASGVLANGSLALAVATDPTQGPAVVSAGEVDVGEALTVRAAVHGGSAGGSFAWTSPAALGCLPSTSSSVACLPSSPGTFSVAYAWTDAAGLLAEGNSSASVAVAPAPAVSAPVPTAEGVDVGEPVAFSAELVANGSGSDTVAWTVTPASGLGCATSSALRLACRPTAAGNFSVNVTVVDSNGGTASAATEFAVDPTVAIDAIAASPDELVLGGSTEIAVDAVGGNAPLAYVYLGLPPGCLSANTSSVACRPATSGSFTVEVVVTDARGLSANRSAVLTVREGGTSPPVGRVAGVVGVGALEVAAATMTVRQARIARRSRGRALRPYVPRGAGVPPGDGSRP